ncbi:hypothetical protein ACLOJK_007014 [Asimina triloba]
MKHRGFSSTRVRITPQHGPLYPGDITPHSKVASSKARSSPTRIGGGTDFERDGSIDPPKLPMKRRGGQNDEPPHERELSLPRDFLHPASPNPPVPPYSNSLVLVLQD